MFYGGIFKKLRRFTKMEDEYPGFVRYLLGYRDRFVDVEKRGFANDEGMDVTMYRESEW